MCPGCKRSKQPLVKTIRLPRRRRSASTSANAGGDNSWSPRSHFTIPKPAAAKSHSKHRPSRRTQPHQRKHETKLKLVRVHLINGSDIHKPAALRREVADEIAVPNK